MEIVAATLPALEPIYEFGAFQVPGQEHVAELRPLFPGKHYIGSDMREGKGVDVLLDLHDIDLPNETAGTVISLDTLEHVEDPRRAVTELHRIVKPEGIVLIVSVMKFPIHEYPYDYWRFTPKAFESLLKPFAFSFVDFAGDSDFPHAVIGIASKQTIAEESMTAFRARFEVWKRRWQNEDGPHTRKGWRYWAKMFTPPIALNVYRAVRYPGSRR